MIPDLQSFKKIHFQLITIQIFLGCFVTTKKKILLTIVTINVDLP